MQRSYGLELTVKGAGGDRSVTLGIDDLIICGWAGRDRAAVEAHIRELEAVGVPRPTTVPVCYRVSPGLLTTGSRIDVLGRASSGEAEAVLIGTERGVLVSVGSDHTDRELETVGVAVSKQVCAKPVAGVAWPFEDVADHWDQLVLRSWRFEGEKAVLYQEGALATLLGPRALVAEAVGQDGTLPPGMALFCGTVPVTDHVRPSERFRFEIEDPVKGRSIGHEYAVRTLLVAR